MRILQVTPGYYPELGGVERHVQSISEGLAQLGHELVVATTATDHQLPLQERIGGVTIQRFRALGPRAYQFPVGLTRFLRQHGQQFDIVHAHNYHALPMLLAALSTRARITITPHYHDHGHNQIADLLHSMYDPFALNVLKHVGGVICVSAAEADLVARRFGLARTQIAVIPNITYTAELPAEITSARAAANAGSNLRQSGQILSVGRLEAYKRVDRIITALPHLPPHYRLTVIGSGPERAKLEQLAEQAGVSDRVSFLGYVADDELRLWYQRAEIVTTFSTCEAFGRVIIEALAGGCRVVCSDIPAFQNFASEFPAAISLIAPATPAREVAAAVLALAQRRQAPISLQRYSQPAILSELEQAYTQIAQRQSLPARPRAARAHRYLRPWF